MGRLLILAVAVCSALGSPAMASDGESSLSLSASYGTYIKGETSPDGGVLGIAFERGFSRALAWRVNGGVGLYRGAGQTSYSGHATAGFTYLLDVLKYVPYVEAGIGGIVIAAGEDGTSVAPLVQGALGLDILRSRTFSYGVRIDFETLFQGTSFFTAGVRATWRWGFF